MSKTYLGVDIGGTAVKLGLVDENGAVLRRAERSVSFDGYKTPILDTVQAAIHEFLTADTLRIFVKNAGHLADFLLQLVDACHITKNR